MISWTNRLLKIAFFVFLLISVLLSWSIYKSFYPNDSVEIELSSNGNTQESQVISDIPPPEFEKYSSLAESDMFIKSKSTKAKKPEPKRVITKEESPFDKFRLIGVVTGTGSISYAVIENTKTKQQVLLEKGELLENGEITSIETNSITIKFEDKNYFLHQRKPSETIPSVSSMGTSTLSSQSSEILNNTIQSDAQAEIKLIAGQDEGIRVLSPGSDGTAFGLATGDLILADSIEQVLEQLENKKSNSRAELVIIREGRQISIEHEPN